ncbi:cupin domain-containing protein [Allorhodopirellula heiligendammensis]|uniref:Cupin domain protein n=1 Tax=Allorhodopirellula heiligendammensis TaxID=2714739 RepID=A0A5C6B1R9_9BACT|nr:cupin domain-containing protein [Allorhodopirellula heiligendammensis]TWU05362.1 Cupin domain protein [Allorhodopirellula heiligendammensis]
MNWLKALFAITIPLAIGVATADNPHEDGERVRVLSVQDIQERVEGKQSKATMVEVTIGPGESGLAHRHPGPGFVYVLEGEYELGIDDKPTKLYQAGETFYEPTGCLHRVSRNPSATGQTRLIAVVLHPHNIDEIAVPVEKHE